MSKKLTVNQLSESLQRSTAFVVPPVSQPLAPVYQPTPYRTTTRDMMANMIQTMNIKGVTSQHLDILVNLKQNNYNVISFDTPSRTIEIMNVLRSTPPDGMDAVIMKLQKDASGVTDFTWKTVEGSKAERNYVHDILTNEKQFEGGESGEPCPRCKKTNTRFTAKQIRRADEPETVIVRCLDCNLVWRVQ